MVYFSATNYFAIKNNPELSEELMRKAASTFTFGDRLKAEILARENILLYILIATSIVLGIIFLMILFLRKRIVIAIALVREGSKAVSSITSSVFFPLIPWILQIGVLGLGIMAFLFLLTGPDPPHTIKNMNDNCNCTGPAKLYHEGSKCLVDMFEKFCRSYDDKVCGETKCHFHGISTRYLKLILQVSISYCLSHFLNLYFYIYLTVVQLFLNVMVNIFYLGLWSNGFGLNILHMVLDVQEI